MARDSRLNPRLVMGGIVLLLALAGGVAAFLFNQNSTSSPTAGGGSPDPPWFEDITERTGLDFVHDVGDVGRWDLPQINGSGVAVFDFDGDGRLDLYVLNHGGDNSKSINRLYRNTPEGRFVDVTAGSGLGIAGANCGVIIGDIDNDGKPDVLVTQVAGCKLFHNLGNGQFRDITEEAGIVNPLWATSANFFDFDRDGLLDLVIANYLQNDPNHPCYNATVQRTYCGPRSFPGTISKLFRNRGVVDGVTRFEDVTIKSGLATAANPGLAVFCLDWTGDGWPDILVANDAKPNHLWVNQKNGTFKEEAFFRGIAVDGTGMAQANMGLGIGDIDGNGMLDVYVTHLASERNTLWLQGPKRGFFQDRTAMFGLASTGWRGTGWGTVMRDFDCDGWPDIIVANGAVTIGTPTPNPELGPHFQDFAERNQVFRNAGEGQFRDISESNAPFCGVPNVGRGIATGDFDGDGRCDFVLTTVANRARVFRNVANDPGHWLIVRAFDPRYHRDAYGSIVAVESGNRTMIAPINPGDSYQCSSDPRAYFGLGTSRSFESLRVIWPDGLEEVFPGGPSNRSIELRRGSGQKVAQP
jgi:enediyne biosynthesis protein E4